MEGNGTPPEGFQSPIRQALTRKHLWHGVPREWLGISAMACAGLWVLFDSLGVIPIFVILYVAMRYKTKKDPWWPEVWKDYIKLWMALHPYEAKLLKLAIWMAMMMFVLAVLWM